MAIYRIRFRIIQNQLFMKEALCPNCSSQYAAHNPPKKLKNCEHCICADCLPTAVSNPSLMQECPIDNKRVEYRRYTAKAFLVDEELLQTVTASSNRPKSSPKAPLEPKNISRPEFQICLLHSKTADLVCCDDGNLICANCALFGEHKGHTVKNSEEFLHDLTSFTEQALGAFDQLKEKEENLSEEIVKDYIGTQFTEARSRELKNIKAGFTKLIQKIRKAEKQAIAELDKDIKERKDALLKQVSLKDIESRKNEWYLEVEDLGSITQQAYNLKQIKEASRYLDGNSSQSFLTKRGEYLQLEFSNLENMIKARVDTEVANVRAQFDSCEIDSALESYCYFGEVPPSSRKPTTPNMKKPIVEKNSVQKNEDDILLEADNGSSEPAYDSPVEGINNWLSAGKQEQGFVERVSPQPEDSQDSTTSISAFSVRVMNCNIAKSVNPIPSPIFTDDNNSSYERNRSISRKKSEINFSSSRSILGCMENNGKKKRRIDIPQKYKQVFEDLKQDRCEVIDFGGAELGDANISALCEYIEKTSRLRNLKLVRNKISDESMKDILNACFNSKVVSLNLGQNSLTEKSLELLEQYDLGEIRNITLSLNKINRRNVKNRLDEFVKRGITISV